MLPELELSVNDDPLMDIDIRPDGQLDPVIDLPAAQSPARVYLASLSTGSQSTMRRALDLSAEVLTWRRCDHLTCPWWLLRKAHTNALRAWLAQNLHYRTGNKILSAVRGTLKAAWDMEQMSTDDYMRAASVKNIKGTVPDQSVGRALTAGEIIALLNVCHSDPSPAGCRDATIIGLGVCCGLRRSEIADLKLSNIDGDRLTVHGKGNKTRTIYLTRGVDDALADWLVLRGTHDGYLLLHIRQGGEIIWHGLSDVAIYNALEKRAIQAGVKDFSPHDLRRTFAGDMLDAGADISTVQRMMGHANISTTAGYDRRGERAKKEAAGRLHLPWKRQYE